MKKLSNWTIVGYSIGVILLLASIVRYFIIWLDYSQAITFVAISILILAISWLFQRTKKQEFEITKTNNKLDYIEDKLEEKWDEINSLLDLSKGLLYEKN